VRVRLCVREVNMSEETHRTCKSCGEVKSIDKFHKNGRRGRHYICAICRNIKRKSWDKSWTAKPERLYKEYKRGAKKRNLSFEISEKDFNLYKDSSCNYCGIKLDRIRLDRVDNDIGYRVDNVVPCCPPCNFLKHTLGKDDFLEHIFKIYHYQKGSKDG